MESLFTTEAVGAWCALTAHSSV